MNETAYTVAAIAMRYFFVAAVLYILARLIYRSVVEYAELKRAKLQASGAYASYILFTEPDDVFGVRRSLSMENSIGRSKRDDICIKRAGVRARHASIYEHKGGAYIVGCAGAVYVNGERLSGAAALLNNGDTVKIGSVCFTYKTRQEALV